MPWLLPLETVGTEIKKLQPMLLDSEDDAFHEDLVSIGPYGEPDDRPLIDPQKIYCGAMPADPSEAGRLESVDQKTIRLVPDLIPGEFHHVGGLSHANPAINILHGDYININAAVYPFGHALCFKLLEAWVPALMQPVGNFWMTVRKQNGLEFTTNINGLDYGDIAGSMDRFVEPYHQYQDEREDTSEIPHKLAVDVLKDPLDPADILDFWLGQGKMYVFKRPDRYVHAVFKNMNDAK